jgi:NAD(P)-dependent dehydrogenase (short-subunit alcohol dehydrogenase family)
MGLLWKASAVIAALIGIILAVPYRELDWDAVIIPMAQNYAESSKDSAKPLSDKIVLVTGATSGIGLALTRALSKMGAQVVALGRNPKKLASLKEEIPSVRTFKIDMGDLESVSKASDQLLQAFPTIDILINNAGMHDGGGNIFGSPPNPQGFDFVFTVNYLSHFLLTEKLATALANSTRPVVLQTSSSYHWAVDGSDLIPDESTGSPPVASQPGGSHGFYIFRSQRSYANSKLAQIYHARSLQERHPALITSKARIVSFCPGWVGTSIGGTNTIESFLINNFGFPMEGWGIASPLLAMFEIDRPDEDYYINTLAFKSIEFLFANLPAWAYRSGIRDVMANVLANFGLVVQRIMPVAGYPGKSSPESYSFANRNALYDWSQAAVAEWL